MARYTPLYTRGKREAELTGKLLLVDDDADTREAFTRLLNLHGVPVMLAADAEEALSLLAGSSVPPTAVALDLLMPGSGGLALLRRLKERTDTARLPVIVMTGLSTAEREARELGCEAFLLKPVTAEVLLKTLRSLGFRPRPPSLLARPAGNT